MKIFCSEFNKNYETYTFGYAIYALLDPEDRLSKAYENGFLPYAGESEYSHNETQEIYYRARSLRINLSCFATSSENRRVLKKSEPFAVSCAVYRRSEFKADDSFKAFCQKYASERFKSGHMNDARWAYILKRRCGSHVFQFGIGSDQKTLGYVLAGIDEFSVHYWFSFFNLDYLTEFPVGKLMMHSVINWANENNKKNVYLGTCYGSGSLYKVRDFKGAEFYDGKGWNADAKLLKQLCKRDDDVMDRDFYKLNLRN